MDELIRLCEANLDRLPDGILRPTYDRSALRPGIVHIGLGNFHRAHQAWFLHRLFQAGINHDWAIIGAGMMPSDAAMREKLFAQDWLTTLIELDPSGMSAEIIGSMIGFVPLEEGNAPLIRQLANPAIRIVTLTVTEGGYFVDPASGELDDTHADILHDASNPERPKTAFGAIVAALALRRAEGAGPLTIQSCDNLIGNGSVTRNVVLGLADRIDEDLSRWIGDTCTFPNSMVDCIVPATGSAEIALVNGVGIADMAPVTHENFRHWVIEDSYCAGRPDWDRVGAIFTDQVHDFETMKLRILNGGHQIIAPVGDLLGLETIAETMRDPLIHGFFRKVETEEILPHVINVPGYTSADYLDLVDRRFSNPAIADTTRRVAFDGSSRQPGFILPSVRDGLESGRSVHGLALTSALWAHYCAGQRTDGSQIPPNDPNWTDLTACAAAAKTDPGRWLEQTSLYGELKQTGFATAFAECLGHLNRNGIKETLCGYLN